MNKVEVFDPPMCCSTGVCGPSVDPALARFSSDLHWLANQRIAVERSPARTRKKPQSRTSSFSRARLRIFLSRMRPWT